MCEEMPTQQTRQENALTHLRVFLCAGSEQTICSKDGKHHLIGSIVISIPIFCIFFLAKNDQGRAFFDFEKVRLALLPGHTPSTSCAGLLLCPALHAIAYYSPSVGSLSVGSPDDEGNFVFFFQWPVTDALYCFIHGCLMLNVIVLLVIVSCTNFSPMVAKRVSWR
jgi:hypothetical protein